MNAHDTGVGWFTGVGVAFLGWVAVGLCSSQVRAIEAVPARASTSMDPGQSSAPTRVNSAVPASAVETPSASGIAFSRGVPEVLHLLDAGVGIEVVLAFVRNSAIPYALSPDEIIALKDRGVPPDLVIAMITRGGEIRANALERAASTPPPAPSAVPTPAPQPVTYSAPPSYVELGTSGYAATPYVSAPSYSYWSGYSYPYYPIYSSWWWPSTYSYYCRSYPSYCGRGPYGYSYSYGRGGGYHGRPSGGHPGGSVRHGQPWSHASASTPTGRGFNRGPGSVSARPVSAPGRSGGMGAPGRGMGRGR